MNVYAIIHNDVSQTQVHPPGEHVPLLALGKFYDSMGMGLMIAILHKVKAWVAENAL